MAIIGKPMNPRLFTLGKPPVPYFNQRMVLLRDIQKWVYNVFITFVGSKTSKPVVLLRDNCNPLGTYIVGHTGQIGIVSLPPYSTAVHQPIDPGAIASRKSKYRHYMLKKIVKGIEHRGGNK